MKESYVKEQPMLGNKCQLSGIGNYFSPKPLKCSNDVPLPQQRLFSSLLSLPRSTIEEEMLRRTEAIDALAEYSQFQKGDTCRLPREKPPQDSSENA